MNHLLLRGGLRSVCVVLIGLLSVILVASNVAAATVSVQTSAAQPPMRAAAEAARFVAQDSGISGVFLSRTQRLMSASAQVDQQGNRHAAFTWAEPDNEHPPAVYLICPAAAACNDVANWQGVALADQVDEVQLQLTPTDQPRMLIKTASTHYMNGKDYWYAACDAGCTNRQAWSLTFVTTSDGTETFDIGSNDLPQHSFALDHQGRPRFVYNDRNFVADPDHYGVYYVTCDAGCTDTVNWHLTHISYATRYDDEYFKHPSLTFTSQNQPRVFANVYAYNPDGSDAPSGFYYLGCDASCSDLNNWKRVYLGEVGSGSFPAPMWNFTLDGSDRPRVIFFTGAGLADRSTDNTLWYAECNTDCLGSAQNWTRVDLGLDTSVGQSPAIQINAQGYPRVAWVQGGKLGYSWCDTACTSAANWQHYYLEAWDEWKREFPQAVPLTCDADVWSARSPVLALDTLGAAHIAFDIQIDARCYEQGPGTPTPEYRFNRIWDTVRWVFVPAGGPQPEATPTTPPSTATIPGSTTTPASTTTAPTTTVPTATAPAVLTSTPTTMAPTATVLVTEPTGTSSTPTATIPTTVATNTPTSQAGMPTPAASTQYQVYLPLVRR